MLMGKTKTHYNSLVRKMKIKQNELYKFNAKFTNNEQIIMVNVKRVYVIVQQQQPTNNINLNNCADSNVK